MDKMFCFQCQQTAKNSCCNISGVCGKKPDTANLQDDLISAIVELSKRYDADRDTEVYELITDSLFMTLTNVNFDNIAIGAQIKRVENKISKASKKNRQKFNVQEVWDDNEDIRSLKSLILFGLKGMAAYAHHAAVLGKRSEKVDNFFVDALIAVGSDLGSDELIKNVIQLGNVNLECMEILDVANTEAYGNPVPTTVECSVESGAFIVVSGHDLHDLKLMLEQTEGKGVNIYTHGEMLPAHGYPQLKKYTHLKGNFGTAWQNQQNDFEGIPAPVLFTTNCLMAPRKSYSDRVYTTSVVGFPELKHIGADKDFSEIIEQAKRLGGYDKKREMTGINGGRTMTTGFAHGTVISVADKVIEAVKNKDIRHFFLVGGCDGAATGRNYYTEFVKATPDDTVILTLACGKFRFNDLDLGTIGGLPRIMDMGQCNDAYSAIKVAVALADAFKCSVNELPLTLVLSWYEQKAVCILLTLLALGIKNIYLGPTLPAFVSPNILNFLVENFGIKPITNVEDDLKSILC